MIATIAMIAPVGGVVSAMMYSVCVKEDQKRRKVKLVKKKCGKNNEKKNSTERGSGGEKNR